MTLKDNSVLVLYASGKNGNNRDWFVYAGGHDEADSETKLMQKKDDNLAEIGRFEIDVVVTATVKYWAMPGWNPHTPHA